ncbi:MAG: ProQ/FinO family protein [Gammaproteobacteria bacterium]|nr:ProQ/FinO family protein [Gammaproteobacteria bacterium]
MSNASFKEQLQAVASQLSDNTDKSKRPKKNFQEEKVKKIKPRWLDYVQYGVELLKVYFPEGFKSGNEIKPLKKGIKQDLVKRLSTLSDIVIEDKACMVKSLSYYVNTANYHRSVVAQAIRIDLDGNSAGTVSAEEASYSIERQKLKHQPKESTPRAVPEEA